MSASLDDADSVFDLNEAIPETELLDNSIQKGRAQLSVKAHRHRPSRSRYHDSMSSTEGDDGLDRKDSPLQSTRAPLHLATHGSSPSPDLLLSSRSPAFSFDTSLGRHSPEDEDSSLAAPPQGRYHQLTNATSQEALVTPSSSPSKSCPSSDCSPAYMRRNRRPDSEGTHTWIIITCLSCDEEPEPGSGLTAESALSEEFSPPHTSYSTSPPGESSSRSSHPYHTLSQSSDEPCDEPSSAMSSWTTQQVCQWLRGLNMEQYVPEFSAKDIDGEQLLQMDGSKLKGLGVFSSSDRSALKRRIRDVQTAAEKERKALEKLEKQKAKQRRKDQEQCRS
ncbi:sterile alpha motif domain-containing protein 14-like [Melanotaenia boesemani]|uniref:sterile alpha motif domain-containing protein 14-like n=1 Tax=Melanotaenia boesemani TaxID=1250792 RepID=UPI001C04A198|nr:sterile alpha motif domain-containing protein 14-like [Melanotaenia boesemani]